MKEFVLTILENTEQEAAQLPTPEPTQSVSDSVQFSDLGLIEPLLRALTKDGYTVPTPIQHKAIPALLEGRDLIGCAQTGTGKTAAFALPLLQKLYKNPTPVSSKCTRILVLSPTRELANQIHDSFGAYGRYLNIRRTAIYGGVSEQGQIRTMAKGVDVLVATPGRLMDLLNRGKVCLDEVEAFVLDEADRMLDMGFIPDIRKIASRLPEERQTLMFSATMEPRIASLAKTLLTDALRVDVAPESTTAETVKQEILFVDRPQKLAKLKELLDNGIYKAIVFTRTKHGANKLDAQLHKSGIKAVAIHGNKSQNARKRALAAFQAGHMQVLVATDVAARGLDIDDVTHVINYDMPDQPDAYVHRIGRTGRAGADGIAISLCDSGERGLLKDIERLIGKSLTGGSAPPPARKGNAGPKRGGPRGNGQKQGQKKFGKKKFAKKDSHNEPKRTGDNDWTPHTNTQRDAQNDTQEARRNGSKPTEGKRRFSSGPDKGPQRADGNRKPNRNSENRPNRKPKRAEGEDRSGNSQNNRPNGKPAQGKNAGGGFEPQKRKKRRSRPGRPSRPQNDRAAA